MSENLKPLAVNHKTRIISAHKALEVRGWEGDEMR